MNYDELQFIYTLNSLNHDLNRIFHRFAQDLIKEIIYANIFVIYYLLFRNFQFL